MKGRIKILFVIRNWQSVFCMESENHNYYTSFLHFSLKLPWARIAAESLGVGQLVQVQQSVIIIVFHKFSAMVSRLSLVLYPIYGVSEITASIWGFRFVVCLDRCITMQLPNFSDFSILAIMSFELYFHTDFNILDAILSVMFLWWVRCLQKQGFFWGNRWSFQMNHSKYKAVNVFFS